MTNTNLAQRLSGQTLAWLTNAPSEVLMDLLNPTHHTAVMEFAFHREAKCTGVRLGAEPVTLCPREQVRRAIQLVDLRYRRQHGEPLTNIRDYLDGRDDGHPGKSVVLATYGTWVHALLAARAPEHLWSAARRARGGNRTDDEFSLAERERALLIYAEAHAGHVPGKGEYERWQLHRAEMPSQGQIRGRRANRKCDFTWQEMREAAAARALAEDGWPLTRERILLEAAR